MQNFAYIIGDESTRKAALVDPAWEVDKLLQICAEMKLTVVYVINTHSHHDHAGGNDAMSSRTGAKIVTHASSPLHKDIAVKDGDTIEVGTIKVKVLHTPGHCPDHICLLFDGKILTGDTLFVGECGRTDLPGGDPEEMYDSLLRRVVRLNDALVVLPGHDYGPSPTSTIGREKSENYTLKPRTREEFLRFLAE